MIAVGKEIQDNSGYGKENNRYEGMTQVNSLKAEGFEMPIMRDDLTFRVL